MAEFLYATSHLAGTCPNPDNVLGNTPSTWGGGPLNGRLDWTSRWAIGDTADPLTADATQTIRVLARKGTNSGTPTIALNLYENGALVQSILAATSVTDTGFGQTLTGTFNSSVITNPANVEIEVVHVSAGGPPAARNSAEIAQIEWEADVSAGIPSGGSGSTMTIAAAGAGTKIGSGGAPSTMTVTATGGGLKLARGGAPAAMAVAAVGAGQPVGDTPSGGSGATMTVTAAGGGQKMAQGGAATGITVTAVGGGGPVGEDPPSGNKHHRRHEAAAGEVLKTGGG